MKRLLCAIAVVFCGSTVACGQYTQADADTACAAAANETASATSEHSAALSGGGSRWYLRGALVNLRCSEQPFTAAALHYARGDWRNAVQFYNNARHYAVVSRRWTTSAVANPAVYPNGIVR